MEQAGCAAVEDAPVEEKVTSAEVLAPLEVLIWPEPILSTPAQPVFDVTDVVRCLFDSMRVTMLAVGGGGLTAPQVGQPLRVLVVKARKRASPEDAPPDKLAWADEFIYLANPEVVFVSEQTVPGMEGCLSFPGVQVSVERPISVRVRGLGYQGEAVEVGGDGLLGQALLHELDHLNGITLADHLSPLKRDLLRRRLTKLKRRGLRYRSQTNQPKEKTA